MVYESSYDLMGSCHLAEKSGNFSCKSNGTVIFREIRSEIVDFLQRKSFFPIQNGTAEIPYHLLNFPVSNLHWPKTITRSLIANGKYHPVQLVCWGWQHD